jgi:uncharacterized protein DUF6338
MQSERVAFVDIFFFQLVVIFIPGIIWERVDAQYGRERAKEQWDVIRRSFIFGLFSYVILFALSWCLSLHYGDLGIRMFQIKKDEAFLDAGALQEVFFASLVAIVCSVLWLYITNYKMLTWFFQKIHATKRYGDEDVWEFMFNSSRPEAEYVHYRDFEKRITYAGWVESFSETEKQRELVLRDVIVYGFEGKILFEGPRVYLARKADNIDIEFPYRAPDAGVNNEQPTTEQPANNEAID